MPEVSGLTLVVAIQSVHKDMRALQAELDADGDEADPELQLLLLSMWKAARELEAAYAHALRMSNNLPSYEQLTRGGT
jgi:hypothetical protein